MAHLPGREPELHWLRERTGDLAGRGVAVVVRGEAGVGKTRLVKEAVPEHLIRVSFPGARFAAPGMGLHHLSRLGGAEGEALARELARPGDPAEPVPEILFAADGVLRPRAPGTVVLDDVQWADDLTLAWLAHAGDLLESTPLAIVLVVRALDELPGRVAAALIPLRRRGLLETHEVGPLDVDGVRDMAAAAGVEADESLARRLHERSDGLPLVVEEMLRTRQGEPTPEVLEKGALGRVPPVVAAIVREALEGLPDDGRLLLAASALAPQQMKEPLLSRVTALDEERFDAALDHALSSGLVTRVDTSGLAYRHDLQREAVEAELGVAARRALHRSWARLLQDEPGHSAAQVAHHLVESGELERAAEWLERAADEAVATHDTGSALTYLMASVRLGPNGSRLVRLAEKATAVARSANRQEEGVTLLDAVLESSLGSSGRGKVLLLRSRLVLDRGDFEGRVETLREARAAFIQAGDHAGHAAVLGSLALPVDGLLPIHERIDLGREGLRLAKLAGDPMSVARCAGNLAAAEISEGNHKEAFDLWRLAMTVVSPEASPEAADEYLRNAGNRALACVAFGLYPEAANVISDGLRVAADRHPRWEGKLRTTEALLLWRLGRWDEAMERAAHSHPVPETYSAMVDALATAVAFERERRPDVEPLVRAAPTLAAHSDHAWAAVAQALLTRIRRMRREPTPARGLMPLVDQLLAAGMRTGWEDLLPAAAEVDHATYRRVLGTLGGLRPAGFRVGAASMLAEGLASTPARDDLVVEAAEAFESLGEPYPAAQALAHATLIRHANGFPASDLAGRAAALFSEVGARRSLAMFLRRAPRVRSVEAFRLEATRNGDNRWALTPREHEVADLARRGHTAAEIATELGISARTAEKHIESVKTKLGAGRKSDLVRLLSEEPTERPRTRADA